MHFDSRFRPDHGDMIFGLSETIRHYAWPHHYRYLFGCIPLGPQAHISFVGRCNQILGRADDRKSLLNALFRVGVAAQGQVTADEADAILRFAWQHILGSGDKPVMDDPVTLYACVFLTDLFAHPRYSLMGPLIKHLKVQITQDGQRFAPAWSVVNATWLASKQMSKFALEQGLRERGMLWTGARRATFHFALDGIDMDRVVDKKDRSHAGGRPQQATDMSVPGYTGSELRYLFRHRHELEGVVCFWRNKREAQAPWVDAPATWARYVPRADVPAPPSAIGRH
ncbi:hypothetical protein FHW69_002680 [Luteibacter sp. Sphag1AF]|uniref:hypothetical protein n=1 Tax=Luteibacter sp. Sphag1AF TaxID=2587031 RepID=UPI00160729EA|nr:hypothetical protein [Luteibacter sp. Sphag1AF]MBB3228045.1 hypothetical protein [Luteibacter sp. Sphag1AF]